MTVEITKKNYNRKKTNAYAPRFPKVKQEGWYLIAAREDTDQIFVLKRLSFQNRGQMRVKIDLPASETTEGNLKLIAASDTYLGLDQELKCEL